MVNKKKKKILSKILFLRNDPKKIGGRSKIIISNLFLLPYLFFGVPFFVGGGKKCSLGGQHYFFFLQSKISLEGVKKKFC